MVLFVYSLTLLEARRGARILRFHFCFTVFVSPLHLTLEFSRVLVDVLSFCVGVCGCVFLLSLRPSSLQRGVPMIAILVLVMVPSSRC